MSSTTSTTSTTQPAALDRDVAASLSNDVVAQNTYTSAPALEVRELGGGKRISQKQALAELDALGAGWRLETPHELFALVDYDHTNQHGAYTRDEGLAADYYWTDRPSPWFEGGRVVVGFYGGDVSYYGADLRARARAVRVSGQ